MANVVTFVHAKLCVHKTVTVGTSLHHLIYNLLIDMVFLIFCHYLTLKNTRRGYAQDKGFSRFNWYQQVGWWLIKIENWDNKNYKRHA